MHYEPHTIYACFYGFLDRWLENLPLSPYFNDTAKLALDFIRSSFVCNGGGFGDDGREGEEEFIFLARFRLLRDFVGKVDQVEAFV